VFLQGNGEVATFWVERCYHGGRGSLPAVDGLAASAGQPCYKGAAGLATIEDRHCDIGRLALLQLLTGVATGADAVATMAGPHCYNG
jgi:hypothetical protein